MKRRRERHKNTPTERRCSNFHPPETPPPRGDPPSVPSATASWCCRPRGVGHSRSSQLLAAREAWATREFKLVRRRKFSKGLEEAQGQDGDPESAICRGIEKCPQCRNQDPCHVWKSHMPMLRWATGNTQESVIRSTSSTGSLCSTFHLRACSPRDRVAVPPFTAAGRRGGQALPFAEDSKQKDAPRWDSVGMFRTVYGVHSYPSPGQSATPVHIGYAREVPTPSCP